MDIIRGRLRATCVAFLLATSSGLAADLCESPPTGLGGAAARLDDHDAEGAKTAARLTARYLDRHADCGGNDRPLFLCSGVLLRGVARETDKYTDQIGFLPWMPSRRTDQKPTHPAGVSASLMRADFQFGKLAYGYTAGFFFYPESDRPTATIAPTVICAYPIDASTDLRGHRTFAYNTGCIREYAYDPISGPCNDAEKSHPGNPVDTPEEYLAQIGPKGISGQHEKQCGFVLLAVSPLYEDEGWNLIRTEANVSTPAPAYATDAAADFLVVVQIMHALNARDSNPLVGESFGTQNELMIRAWDVVPSTVDAGATAQFKEAADAVEKQAPIEAFFYLAGSSQGPANARLMQQLFLQRTGVWRPVIRFTLAKSMTQRAGFAYDRKDQSP